jgi:flavodoxin
MKKILVVYYSRTGHTKEIAKEIAEELKADIDEIIDLKNRKGMKGYITGGKDAIEKKLTEIKFSKEPKNYNLVIVGTPNWAKTMPPAVRTYLERNKNIKQIAFFCTYGNYLGKIFQTIEEVSKKPLATLSIRFKSFSDKAEPFYENKLEKFCEELK